jgi:hypothetical protein
LVVEELFILELSLKILFAKIIDFMQTSRSRILKKIYHSYFSIEANDERSNLFDVLDNNGDAMADNDDAFDDSEDGDDAEAGSSNNATTVIQCELCSTTTQSKQSMRRHCLQSHDLVS